MNINTNHEMNNTVSKGVVDSELVVIENNPKTDVNPSEKLSNKASESERAKNHKKYLEAQQSNVSSNTETIYLNVEIPSNHIEIKSFRPVEYYSKNVENSIIKENVTRRISSTTSVSSNESSCCCSSLNESGIAAAKFSIFVSIVLLLISAQKFFKSPGDDDNTEKMFYFSAGVYALCYLHSARKLINGIEKEMRNKFIAWIGFSILTIFFLFSGIIYIVISSWGELKDIEKEPVIGGHIIALIVLLLIVECALIYCTRIVLLLWNSLHEDNSASKGSCVSFVNHFCSSCALSCNSFSRAVSH